VGCLPTSKTKKLALLEITLQDFVSSTVLGSLMAPYIKRKNKNKNGGCLAASYHANQAAFLLSFFFFFFFKEKRIKRGN